MKILTVILKQHTPLIHFQHTQYGATLRASEVKPKLDRFLFAKLGEGDIEKGKKDAKGKGWTIGREDKVALDYKMHIRTDSNEIKMLLMNEPKSYDPTKYFKEYGGKKYLAKRKGNGSNAPLIYDLKTYPLYFGNMGTDYVDDPAYRKMSFTKEKIKVEFLTAHKELYDYLNDKEEHILADFFMTHNFGTRQSKGFGSFYIDKGDELYVDPKAEYRFTLGSFNNKKYDEDRFTLLFNQIDMFYKTLRSGINLKDRIYFKSLAFMYAKKLGMHWDKWGIKEVFYNEKNSLLGEINEESKVVDIRDMLGFSTKENWLSFRDVVEKKVAIKNQEGEFVFPDEKDILPAYRMASPLLIKVVGNDDDSAYSVFLIPRDKEVGMDEFKKNEKICAFSKFRKDERGCKRNLMMDIPQKFSIDNYLEYIFKELKFDICKHVKKCFQPDENTQSKTGSKKGGEFVALKKIFEEINTNLDRK